MAPRVSVLIPLYNCEKYIGAAIKSVLAQTYDDYEIIVADDGSTDSGADIVKSFSKVSYHLLDHGGIAKARNFLIRSASGEFITFIDSDDLWAPEKLQLQVSYLDSLPECGIVFCRYKNFTDIPDSEYSSRQSAVLFSEIDHYMAGACIRKSLFDEFGLFRENYNYGEDTEWIARLQISKVDLSHKICRYLYFRRIHESNTTLAHSDMSEKARYTIMSDAIRAQWRRKKNES